MGKRSDFKRRAQDAYDTPPEAVTPLLSHLPKATSFFEPCAGAGHLVDALQSYGHVCTALCDIEPRRDGIARMNGMSAYPEKDVCDYTYIITNPPWTRQILHPMIEHFSDMRPTWLLFDADWVHTKQAAPFMWRLKKIVSVGRVSWMQNGTSGKDDCAWHLFDAHSNEQTRFFGRSA